MLKSHIPVVEVGLVLEQHGLSGPREMPLERLPGTGPALVHLLMSQARGMRPPAIEHLGDVADRLAHLDEPKIQIHVLRDAHLLVESADLADQLGPGGDQMNEERMAEVMVVRECRPDIDTANGVKGFARDCLVTIDHVGLIVKDGLGEPVQGMRFEEVVVIHEEDVVPLGHAESTIRRGGHATVPLGVDDDHP